MLLSFQVASAVAFALCWDSETRLNQRFNRSFKCPQIGACVPPSNTPAQFRGRHSRRPVPSLLHPVPIRPLLHLVASAPSIWGLLPAILTPTPSSACPARSVPPPTAARHGAANRQPHRCSAPAQATCVGWRRRCSRVRPSMSRTPASSGRRLYRRGRQAAAHQLTKLTKAVGTCYICNPARHVESTAPRPTWHEGH